VLEDGEAGDVAARPREACDKPIADRIGDHREHNRCDLGPAMQRRQDRGTGRHNHVCAKGVELGGERLYGRRFGPITNPALFDPYIAAIDPAEPP